MESAAADTLLGSSTTSITSFSPNANQPPMSLPPAFSTVERKISTRFCGCFTSAAQASGVYDDCRR